jgi:hypothetical protein
LTIIRVPQADKSAPHEQQAHESYWDEGDHECNREAVVAVNAGVVELN